MKLFSWFKKKKKPAAKSEITLTYKDESVILISVEGDNIEFVSYVSNRIKDNFNIKNKNYSSQPMTEEEMKNMEGSWNKMWEQFEKMFDRR